MSHMNAENSVPTLCSTFITAVAWLHAVAAVFLCCVAQLYVHSLGSLTR